MSDDAPRKTEDRRDGDRRGGERRAGDRRVEKRRASGASAVPAVLEVCDEQVAEASKRPVERIVVQDRRRHERIGLRHEAGVKHHVVSADGRLDDISTGGARFTTTDLELNPPKGAFVAVSFSCHAGERKLTLICVGRVVRSRAFHDGEAHVRSLSVRFVDPLDISELTFDC
jgi:hypothetical protein